MTAASTPRVLVVASKYPPEYAGSGLRAKRTYMRLAVRFGVRWEVLCSGIAQDRNAVFFDEGIRVTRIAWKPFRYSFPDFRLSIKDGVRRSSGPGFLFSRIMRRIVLFLNYWPEAIQTFLYLYRKRRDFDLIHIFGDSAVTSMAVQFATLFRIPLILELCNQSDRPWSYRPFPLCWIPQRSKYAQSSLVCISESLRRMAARHGYTDKVWCRPNPVDETRFIPFQGDRVALRAGLFGARWEDPLVLYVAPLTRHKNHRLLLEAFQRLPPSYRLCLICPSHGGVAARQENSTQREIEELIDRQGLRARVIMHHGFVEKVEDYFKAADVYAMPSLNEALGTPMLESLACGVPVVALRLTGVTDMWIEPGVNGFLSAPTPGPFAEGILKAQSLDRDLLRNRARELMTIASTRVVDDGYFKLIQQSLQLEPPRT